MSNCNPTCLDNHYGFRALLSAMSRPGTVQQLPAAQHREPYDGLLQLLATLLDPQVSFFLIGDDELLRRRIQQQTAARSGQICNADFLVAPGGDSNRLLLQAKRGDLAYPDRSATIVYQVEGLAQLATGPVRLSGPGIRDQAFPQLTGLAENELRQLQDLNQEFPLGIDALFVDPRGQVMAIPRTTCIEGV